MGCLGMPLGPLQESAHPTRSRSSFSRASWVPDAESCRAAVCDMLEDRHRFGVEAVACQSSSSAPEWTAIRPLPDPTARQVPGNVSQPLPSTGPRRWLFLALGFVFTGLGGIGVILPGIPTTPFLLLASYCFVRSSPRLHQWLLDSKTFGPLLRDWQRHRGVKRRVKRVAIAGCAITITLSIALGGLPWPGRILVALAGAYGIWFVARLPVVPDGPP